MTEKAKQLGNELAYPGLEYDKQTNAPRWYHEGFSKRERIAAQAMQGMLANPMFSNNSSKHVAELAMWHADALLEELCKTNTNN
jgi:hypothetical protein